MSDAWNRWAGYHGDDLERPDTKRKKRNAIDRDAEYSVIAESLGRAWRRSGGHMTPEIRAALDALAAL